MSAATDQGLENAAILLMSLGEEEASEVFKHLSPKEVQSLGETIASMKAVTRERLDGVLASFCDTAAEQHMLVADNDEYVRAVLRRALGEEKANLLLDRHYNLRIADFGLVKKVTSGQRLTPGTCTLWWRAPEVLLADRVRAFSAGPAIDLWAAGVVLTNVAAGPDAKGSFHCYDKPIPAAQAIWNICGSPEAGWPAVVKTPNWQAMRPQSKKIQPALRRMYGGRG
jgi:serine/threonine protein kinase